MNATAVEYVWSASLFDFNSTRTNNVKVTVFLQSNKNKGLR